MKGLERYKSNVMNTESLGLKYILFSLNNTQYDGEKGELGEFENLAIYEKRSLEERELIETGVKAMLCVFPYKEVFLFYTIYLNTYVKTTNLGISRKVIDSVNRKYSNFLENMSSIDEPTLEFECMVLKFFLYSKIKRNPKTVIEVVKLLNNHEKIVFLTLEKKFGMSYKTAKAIIAEYKQVIERKKLVKSLYKQLRDDYYKACEIQSNVDKEGDDDRIKSGLLYDYGSYLTKEHKEQLVTKRSKNKKGRG